MPSGKRKIRRRNATASGLEEVQGRGGAGGAAANECEENMVIFHKNRQMRTQPEATKKARERERANRRKTGKAANNNKKPKKNKQRKEKEKQEEVEKQEKGQQNE